MKESVIAGMLMRAEWELKDELKYVSLGKEWMLGDVKETDVRWHSWDRKIIPGEGKSFTVALWGNYLSYQEESFMI